VPVPMPAGIASASARGQLLVVKAVRKAGVSPQLPLGLRGGLNYGCRHEQGALWERYPMAIYTKWPRRELAIYGKWPS
jgi:hypothetical protein